jgi:hypothetical protein
MRLDIDNYHRVFSKYPKCLMESDGRVYGVWMIGNDYKAKAGYYGEYPPSFLERIMALCGYSRTLHLFSGSIQSRPGDMTVDINPALNPDLVCSATDVSQYTNDVFPLIMADPPYSAEHAAKYGTKPINKPKVMREMRKMISDNGILAWLDTSNPIYRGPNYKKGNPEWSLIGFIAVYLGTNKVYRAVTFFEPVV